VNVQFSKAFGRDVRALSEAERMDVSRLIQAVVAARSLNELPGVKKLKGGSNAFRIRSGDRRIGFYLEGDTVRSEHELFGNFSGQTFLLGRDAFWELFSEVLVQAAILFQVNLRRESVEFPVNWQLKFRDGEGLV
jgi:mRNA interferase RelE/StbE